jgi:hypothetical protein
MLEFPQATKTKSRSAEAGTNSRRVERAKINRIARWYNRLRSLPQANRKTAAAYIAYSISEIDRKGGYLPLAAPKQHCQNGFRNQEQNSPKPACSFANNGAPTSGTNLIAGYR